MAYLWPSDEQLNGFIERADPNTPVSMLNLLAYRDEADYANHPDESPCSGREAYRRYADQALACVESYGGKLIFFGAAAATVIGPDSVRWHDVLIVEYPSPQAFSDMVTSERYQSFAYHRTAALSDSRLIPMAAGVAAYAE